MYFFLISCFSLFINQNSHNKSSLGVKRPGSEADHSPPSSAEVKKAWSYTSTPQYVFKHRDNFTFTLPYLTINQQNFFYIMHYFSFFWWWRQTTLHYLFRVSVW
jgi:hypothetical protein